MALPVFFDRVSETSVTTGTSTMTLAGAVAGYRAFSAVIGSGTQLVYYTITDTSNGWEVGQGTYTFSGTTLSRTTILASSNSNAAVSWAAGTKTVWLDMPAIVPGAYQVSTDGNTLSLATGGGTQAQVTDTATAVNYLTVTGAATGNPPAIGVAGSNSAIGLNLSTKGIGDLNFYTNGALSAKIFAGSSSAVNYPTLQGNTTGGVVWYSVDGTDSDITINLAPKGNGNVQVNGVNLVPPAGIAFLQTYLGAL